MLSVEKCKEYIPNRDINDRKIKEIRNYIYSLTKEIICKNIKTYEESNRKATEGKQGER
jgi:hypothetical protein